MTNAHPHIKYRIVTNTHPAKEWQGAYLVGTVHDHRPSGEHITYLQIRDAFRHENITDDIYRAEECLASMCRECFPDRSLAIDNSKTG
jgi:hypothetical protein